MNEVEDRRRCMLSTLEIIENEVYVDGCELCEGNILDIFKTVRAMERFGDALNRCTKIEQLKKIPSGVALKASQPLLERFVKLVNYSKKISTNKRKYVKLQKQAIDFVDSL